MANDPRDRLWKVSFKTYYDSYYHELCANALINRWLTVDTTTNFLVAATVSGSAIAGWALWSSETGKVVWAIIAGIAALLSIASTSLRVQLLLQQYNEALKAFTDVRVQLETFRQELDLNPLFSIVKATKTHKELRNAYSKALQKKPNDFLNTRKFAESMQDRLNDLLGDQIEKE
jgi:hypothetical protein